MRAIAKNIRTLRIAKNMTQDELAERLFVTRQTVSNYETGKSRPDIDMLARIAEVLETDVNTLIYGPPVPVSRKQDYLVAAVCTTFLLLNLTIYAYLKNRFNFIARMFYGIKPTLLLMTVYRPLLYSFSGWTILQILSCITTLKPFAGPKVNQIQTFLWLSLVLFFAAEAPIILGCFVNVTFSSWWVQLSWYVHGNSLDSFMLNLSLLPIGIGAGLWLCNFPKALHK